MIEALLFLAISPEAEKELLFANKKVGSLAPLGGQELVAPRS